MEYIYRLLNIPWYYYGMAIMFGFIVRLKTKNIAYALLVFYVFAIFVGTVLCRKPFIGNHFQPKPFWSWEKWQEKKEQIVFNIIMYVPIGLLVGYLWKWKGLIGAIVFSTFIELIQLVTKTGLCEFDDVIHNSLGAVIGISIILLIESKRKMIAGKRT